jgi:hypothetical protein
MIGTKPETAPKEGDLEPKGYPTADRYRAETVHVSETDNHTEITEKASKK